MSNSGEIRRAPSVSMEGYLYRPGVAPLALMDAYAKSDRRLLLMTADLLRKWL